MKNVFSEGFHFHSRTKENFKDSGHRSKFNTREVRTASGTDMDADEENKWLFGGPGAAPPPPP